jgi:hypothetical protein
LRSEAQLFRPQEVKLPVPQGGVVFLHKLVEQRLLRPMAFVGGVTEGILAW